MKENNLNNAFEYENGFYRTSDISRMGKLIAHYELFKMSQNLAGDIAEFGVFKGASLIRFASYMELFEYGKSRNIYGFDVFDSFPETEYNEDKVKREAFIQSAGEQSISDVDLMEVLQKKGIGDNVTLVKGDITKTLPEFLEKNPEKMFSLVNLDTDIYEPAEVILKYIYPRLVKGGILILDDYGVFPGETLAVNQYFEDKEVTIRKFGFSKTPVYIIKE